MIHFIVNVYVFTLIFFLLPFTYLMVFFMIYFHSLFLFSLLFSYTLHILSYTFPLLSIFLITDSSLGHSLVFLFHLLFIPFCFSFYTLYFFRDLFLDIFVYFFLWRNSDFCCFLSFSSWYILSPPPFIFCFSFIHVLLVLFHTNHFLSCFHSSIHLLTPSFVHAVHVSLVILFRLLFFFSCFVPFIFFFTLLFFFFLFLLSFSLSNHLSHCDFQVRKPSSAANH